MVITGDPGYSAWQRSVPHAIKEDRLWRMSSYRLALYASDRGWDDVVRLASRPVTQSVADQLLRALGSIGANLAEGYSRSSGRDRARIFEYALGSARESRHWYHVSRMALGFELVNERDAPLHEITRILLSAIPEERTRTIRQYPPCESGTLASRLDESELDSRENP